MTTWASYCDAYSYAYAEFVVAASSLSPARRQEPGVCGTWSPHDVAAHMIYWEAEAGRRFQQFLTGPTPDLPYDTDAINAQTVARYRGESWQTVMEALADAHRYLHLLTAHLTPEQVEAEPRFEEWLVH